MAGNVVEMVLRLKDGASASLKSAGKSAKATDIDMKKLAKGALAVGAGFLAASALVVKFTQKMADYKNEVIDASTRTGVAVDTMAGLRLAAKGSGLQFSAMESVLKVYTSKIAAADRGTAEAVEGFENLGVSIYDTGGNLRDSDEIFRDTLAALGEMEPGTARTAAAVNALGTQSTKLFQALGDPKNLDHFVEKTRQFGVDFGPKAAAAAGDWQRAMADLGDVSMGSADKITRGLGADGAAGAVYALNEAIIYTTSIITEGVIPAFNSYMRFISGTMGLVFNGIKLLGLEILATWQSTIDKINKATGMFQSQHFELKKTEAAIVRTKIALKESMFSAEDLASVMTGGMTRASDAMDVATAAAKAYRKSTQIPTGEGDDGTGALGTGAVEVLEEVAAAAEETAEKLEVTAGGFNVFTLEAKQQSAEILQFAENLRLYGQRAKQTTEGMGIAQISMGQKLQTGAQAIGGAALGAVGISGAGSVVALLAEGPKAIRETAADLQKSLMTAMKTLPIALGEIIPEVMTELPGALIEAMPQLIAGMVEATPKMMKAVAIDLPIAFMRAIVDADWSRMAQSIGESFKAWWESIKQWVIDLFSFGLSNRNDENLEWWRLRAKWQERNKDDETGSFAVGARFVDRTGMALIHQGEQIVPRGGSTTGTAARTMGGGGGVNVTINTNVVDSDALPALVRQLERVYGTFGRSSSTLFAS